MIFSDSSPIYIQIAELISDKIISGAWCPGERIPSVRELGGILEVNPNTVMRSYEWLSERGVIVNKRGVGFFVTAEAHAIITEQRCQRLASVELREIARQMVLLDMPIEQVIQHLEQHLKEIKENKVLGMQKG